MNRSSRTTSSPPPHRERDHRSEAGGVFVDGAPPRPMDIQGPPPVVSTGRGPRRLAARHPIATFLVLGLSSAYALMLLWGLAYHGTIPGGSLADELHIAPDELAGLLSVLGLFPTALFVIWAGEGPSGVTRHLRRMTHWRVNFGWWLLVLTGLPLITTGSAVVLGHSVQPVDLLGMFVSQLGLLAINFVMVNFWEEAAWAGLFQTRLERRHNIFAIAVLSAVPFALAHLPLQFFLPGEVTATTLVVAFILYFLVSALVRPMLATFLRGTGDSLLLVALLHSVFNRTNNDDGIVAALTSGDARLVAMAVGPVLLTAAVAIPIRRRLTRSHRLKLDAASRYDRPTAGGGTTE
jgi:membrane protease YdiL (CAAX protease family)